MTSIGDFGISVPETVAPPRLGRGARRALRSALWVAVLLGLTGITLDVAATVAAQKSGTAQPHPATNDAWIEVNRPIELFGLGGTEFARLPYTYRARRHVEGGGRRDILVFGDPQVEAPSLALSFYRLGREAAAPLPFGQDVAALAREGGVAATPGGSPAPLDTRFGPFEAADVRIADGRTRMPCLGFRNVSRKGDALRIAGLMCGAAGRPLARDGLGCVIDRIDLLSAGDDVALQRIFVAAERRRGSGCMPSSLTAAGSRPTWLDANATLPSLRGSSNGPVQE